MIKIYITSVKDIDDMITIGYAKAESRENMIKLLEEYPQYCYDKETGDIIAAVDTNGKLL